jgi:tRNA threonylcarbamoyladenosine biosynthesis protein TsaE
MTEGKSIALPDETATAALGAAVERALDVGEAVCLTGPLGAGKTSFARGLVRAATSPEEEVPSPTFTLVQQYDGRRFPLAHFDLYRLEHAGEAAELGLDEALDVGAAIIEWPDRLGGDLPPDRLDLELEFAPDGRLARMTGHGAWRTRVAALDL